MNGDAARARALAYLRRKGTDASPDSIRARVAATYAELERRLAALDAEVARRKPDADIWCVQEVVDHLAASAEPAIDQLRALIEGRSPGDEIPAGLIGPEPLAPAWPEAVGRLERAQRRHLEELERVPDDLPLERTVPVAMLLELEDESGAPRKLAWTERLDWKAFALIAHVHTLEHLDQIERILAAIGDRD